VESVQFEEMFPWQLTAAIARAPIAYLPLGVLEWHGEHNAVGLDAIKAHAVCVATARISGGVVLPALHWATDWREELPNGNYLMGGVEYGERYHVPGNAFWLRPETYHNLLLDIYETLRRRGFRAIVVLSGHWSDDTLATLAASGSEFTRQHPAMGWLNLTDQEVVPELFYPHEHAAGGETSLLMAIRPDLVDLSLTLETGRSLAGYYVHFPQHLQRRRTTPNKYIGVLTAAEGEANDPELSASAERGRALLVAISQHVAERATDLLRQVQP
jgi:creatinine amidohydrolase